MSVIAEFTVPSKDFALHETLTAVPEIVVEIERVVATKEDRIMPYFWVYDGDQSRFEAALADDSSIQDPTRVDHVDDSVLYRAEWTENVESIIYAYTDIGATILRATAREKRWALKLRFDDHEELSEFDQYCRDNEIPFELDQLYEQTRPGSSEQYGLTPKQRKTLVTALELGYYDVPQEETMADVAEALGISQQALSKRLHHGHKNLISNALTVTESKKA